jgi:cyclopropane-fatty-acyl-phospholipid synthase
MWQSLLEQNRIPDALIRQGIRYYNRQHLKRLAQGGAEAQQARLMEVVATLRTAPLAVATEKANEQHYELPPAFFEYVLGPHLKYSCGYWKNPHVTLAQSESDMLAITCHRAAIQDHTQILELGCGWGSLTIYMAQKYPHSQITAVSNSRPQRLHIEKRVAALGLSNVKIITADINNFAPEEHFDHIVSVEMFEHMRNYQTLFSRLFQWLKPGGHLFTHVFAHRQFAYLFEVEHERDWMAKYFFTGGTMPSKDLFLYFCSPLRLKEQWVVDGRHYQRTSEAWLANMDNHRTEIEALFAETYGPEAITRWWAYWRVFFLSCAELFGHADGQEWYVTHCLFEKTAEV